MRTFGQRTVGQRTVGQRSVGQRTIGQRTVGQRTNRWPIVNGRLVNVRLVNGQLVNGRLVNGQLVKGRLVNERLVKWSVCHRDCLFKGQGLRLSSRGRLIKELSLDIEDAFKIWQFSYQYNHLHYTVQFGYRLWPPQRRYKHEIGLLGNILNWSPSRMSALMWNPNRTSGSSSAIIIGIFVF